MTKTDLIELADRVEALEGADREVDALIWCAIHGKRYKGHFQAYGSQETQVEFTEPPKRTQVVSDGRNLPHAPQWTASLDAAMTLVPDPGKWSVTAGHQGDWQACCWFDGQGFLDWRSSATPALALCAAALRARASMGEG